MKTGIKYVIVQDYETGGLPNKTLKPFIDIALCEVACVVIDMQTLSIIDEYQNLFKPHYKGDLVYQQEALNVNGLTLEMMEEKGVDARDIYKDLKALYLLYKNPRHGAVICGHNFTAFDHPFTVNMFEYFGDDVWNYVKWVEDTQKIAYYSSVEQQDYKLHTCCMENSIELVDAHRAIHDTRANAQLFISYIKRLRGEGLKKKEEVFQEKFQFQIPH